jgi:multiple sugar transport system permease protein
VTQYKEWEDIFFSNRPPTLPAQHTDWADFITTRMSAANVTLAARPSDADFRAWLLKQYDSLERINLKLGTKFQSLDEITFPDDLPADKRMRWSWVEFAAKNVPADHWSFPHPLQSYHDFLQRRYGTVEKLAAAYGQPVTSFEQMRLPQAAFDRAEFLARKRHWVRFFLTDNFTQVIRYIAVRGYALWNTVILVSSTLIASLTINPLAAYALSRFRIRWSRAILILFLVPMAFPGEVAQIPSFILTRDLGLLNTYWALILPGLANGFGIFLLKGFFDGLPRELYEAAELDGANEIQIYWNVTFPLCKPILALTVLGVVIAAYSGFMWAFIVCPDQKMWTLAVWVFQFSVDAAQQGRAHLQMAALVLMSIPTLIIFLFTQKIIMKGIVLPTMK